MGLYQNNLYMEDVHYVVNMDIPWEKLKDKENYDFRSYRSYRQF